MVLHSVKITFVFGVKQYHIILSMSTTSITDHTYSQVQYKGRNKTQEWVQLTSGWSSVHSDCVHVLSIMRVMKTLHKSIKILLMGRNYASFTLSYSWEGFMQKRSSYSLGGIVQTPLCINRSIQPSHYQNGKW